MQLHRALDDGFAQPAAAPCGRGRLRPHLHLFQRVESGSGGGGVVEPGPSERCTITLSDQRP